MKEKAWIVVFPMIFWSFFDLYFYNTFLQGCYLLLKILWRHTSCSSPALEVGYRSASFVTTMAMTWDPLLPYSGNCSFTAVVRIHSQRTPSVWLCDHPMAS